MRGLALPGGRGDRKRLPRLWGSSNLAPGVKAKATEDRHMSADGTWKVAMKTPIGERKGTLSLTSAGASLTGTMTNEEGASTAILDGKAAGNSVSFKVAIKNPMPLTLEFSGSVDGDKISGTVNASGVGNWPFSGTRG